MGAVRSYRIVFSKTGRIRFIGHLDLTQALRRAIKRASVPVKYSKGFNPHMEFSVAMPLSLGMEGFGEYADLMVNDETEQFDSEKIALSLKETVPAGIEILKVFLIPAGSKSSAATIEKAEFTVVLPEFDDFEFVSKRVEKILKAKEIVVCKKTKKAETLTDIRADIFNLEAFKTDSSVEIKMTLSAGSLRNLKPSLVLDCLMTGGNFDITALNNAKYVRNRLILSGQN